MIQERYIELYTDNLIITIAKAETVYKRCRFEHGGQIVQVQYSKPPYKGACFCGSDMRTEALNCGGIGLMNEFMPSDQGTYENAAQYGNKFIKMGVGILHKTGSEPYSQKTEYSIAEKIDITESINDGTYIAEMYKPDFYGYSYRLEKRITTGNEKIHIFYELVNTGSKILSFCEYNHNFYALGGSDCTEECTLSFSFTPRPEKDNVFIVKENELMIRPFKETCAGALYGWGNKAQACIKAYNAHTKLYAEETVSGCLQRCYVWGLKDVLCPELIVKQSVLPKNKVIWQREYSFGVQ